MTDRQSAENVYELLACANLLEEKTHLLYMALADRVETPLVKSMILQIAYDSKKHAAIFQGISQSLPKQKRKTGDCEKKLGEVWRIMNDLSQKIADERKPLFSMELTKLTGELTLLESSLGEEYYVLVQAETLHHMTKEINALYNINLSSLKETLQSVIEDEEHHRELLATIKEALEPKKEESQERTPKVKYQRPDAWIRSTP